MGCGDSKEKPKQEVKPLTSKTEQKENLSSAADASSSSRGGGRSTEEATYASSTSAATAASKKITAVATSSPKQRFAFFPAGVGLVPLTKELELLGNPNSSNSSDTSATTTLQRFRGCDFGSVTDEKLASLLSKDELEKTSNGEGGAEGIALEQIELIDLSFCDKLTTEGLTKIFGAGAETASTFGAHNVKTLIMFPAPRSFSSLPAGLNAESLSKLTLLVACTNDTNLKADLVPLAKAAVERNKSSAQNWITLGSCLTAPSLSAAPSPQKQPQQQQPAFNEEDSGNNNSGCGVVKIGDESYTERDCYIQALKCDPRECRAWYNLALTVPWRIIYSSTANDDAPVVEIPACVFSSSSSSSSPNKKSDNNNNNSSRKFSRRECFLESVRADPTSSYAWNGLGLDLRMPGETVSTDFLQSSNSQLISSASRKQHFSQRDCFLRAIECHKDNAFAWNNLGNTLPHHHSAATNVVSHVAAGSVLSPSSNASSPSNNVAAANLVSSVFEKEGVDDANFNVEKSGDGGDVVVAAVVPEISSNNDTDNSSTTAAAAPPAEQQQQSPAAPTPDRRRPSLQVANLTGDDSDILFHNTSSTSGAYNSVDSTKKQWTKIGCYIRALEIDPGYGKAWNNLGAALARGELATVNGLSDDDDDDEEDAENNNDSAIVEAEDGEQSKQQQHKKSKQLSKVDCYIRAVRCNEHDAVAWTNLGSALERNQKANVRLPSVVSYSSGKIKKKGCLLSKKQCFIAALIEDSTYRTAWKNLGNSLVGNEAVNVNGLTVTKRECASRASG